MWRKQTRIGLHRFVLMCFGKKDLSKKMCNLHSTLTVEWKDSRHSLLPNAMFAYNIGNITHIEWLFIDVLCKWLLTNHIDSIEWFIDNVEIILFDDSHVHFWLKNAIKSEFNGNKMQQCLKYRKLPIIFLLNGIVIEVWTGNASTHFHKIMSMVIFTAIPNILKFFS